MSQRVRGLLRDTLLDDRVGPGGALVEDELRHLFRIILNREGSNIYRVILSFLASIKS